jgi:hypothetical protein
VALLVHYQNARYLPISETHHRETLVQPHSNRLSLDVSAFHKTLCTFIGGHLVRRRRVGGEVIIFISISTEELLYMICAVLPHPNEPSLPGSA